MVRQRIPIPHGVWFIIGIHQGFLPFPVGDGLFKNASDCAAFVAIIEESNPNLGLGQTHRLRYRYNSCITNDPKADHTVLLQHALGIDFGEGG